MGKGWYLQVCHHVADLPRRTQAFKPQENPNLTLNTPRVVEDVGLHTGVQSFSGWWFLQYFFFGIFTPKLIFTEDYSHFGPRSESISCQRGGSTQLNSTEHPTSVFCTDQPHLFHLLIHGYKPWGSKNPLIRSPLIRSQTRPGTSKDPGIPVEVSTHCYGS